MLMLFTICLIACNTNGSGVKSSTFTAWTDQEATVEAHVISRGKFQYIIAVSSGEHAGQYLPEKELAEIYCHDGMPVKINAKVLTEKGMVYKPGPTDIPEKDFEVPVIRITAITKQ